MICETRAETTLGIVVYQWNNGFREYLPEHVNSLARAVKRNLSIPHRFFCITEETEGFSSDVKIVPLPDEAREAAQMPSQEGPRFPASYRRLWTLSESAKCLGDRVMVLDIDCTVTRNIDPLFEIENDFVGWRPSSSWGSRKRIGGGTWLVRTGTHAHIWEEFSRDPQAVAKRAREANYRGSDQAVLSYYLAEECTVWPEDSGIYQAQQMKRDGFKTLPADARIVHFNGRVKPWSLMQIPWIRDAVQESDIERRIRLLESRQSA